jgi:hypothetical protein
MNKENIVSLNRFPIFGLFAQRVAVKLGYKENEAKLLGHGTALLYSIFKNSGGKPANYKKKNTNNKMDIPLVKKENEAHSIKFGAFSFQIVKNVMLLFKSLSAINLTIQKFMIVKLQQKFKQIIMKN